jgi:glucose-6-phosphate 1-epimerase
VKATTTEFRNLGPAVVLEAPDGATATVCLHGGQVVSWRTAEGTERLFVSSKASAVGAIRGGVPICFPQFASLGPLPKHGYARTSAWRHRSDGRFVLDVQPGQWAGFDGACALTLDVSLGPAALALSLSVDNVGPTTVAFTGALHTYLQVEDITMVRVDGLDEHPISFESEVDLSVIGVSRPAMVSVDGEPFLLCVQTGFTDSVVWNIGDTQLRR